MKKTYISPAFVTVQMNVTRAILTVSSLTLDSSDDNKITGSGDILVKESTVSDVNVWDSEW